MPHQVTAYDTHGQKHINTVDKHPDYCPLCHHAIEPKSLGDSLYLDTVPSSIEALYCCPRHLCGHVFIARYRLRGLYGDYGLCECVPYELQEIEFSQEIKELSPDFCAIFNQARNAEHLRLSLIAGGGYRKALEFLVKDYAIRLSPSDSEQIKKTDLGPCIQTYISNPMVEENSFRDQPAINQPIPSFEETKGLLPQPVWDGHESALQCYWKAWELAFKT